jgi:hypothetical protein
MMMAASAVARAQPGGRAPDGAAAAGAPAPNGELPDAVAPPPNPAAGERTDARLPRPSARDELLLVPRLVLAPLRLILRGLSYPVRWFVENDQRNHVYQHIVAAFTSDDGQIGVRPMFAYATSFYPEVGLRFYDAKLLGPATDFNVAFMTGGIYLVHASAGVRPTRIGAPVTFVADAVFDRRNDRLYTGIGNSVDHRNPSARYASDDFDVRADLRLRLAPWLVVAAGGSLGVRRYGNGADVGGDAPIADVYCVRTMRGACTGVVSDALVPGFHEGTRFVRTSLRALVDSLDDGLRPTTGWLVIAGADYTHGLGGRDQSSYFRLRGEANVAINLWQRTRVLLLRAQTTIVVPLGDAQVPFSELAVLGGPETLRGFRVGEFRDDTSLMFTAEYRWPIWMWIDGSLFADYGGVFGRWYQGFGAHQMQADLGIGVRIFGRGRFFLRAQLAYGFGGDVRFFIAGASAP